ncbi:MAG: hypothetical protein RLZZ347_491 [Candidatus Parcubacteria bacterium]|jgi:hypothetical protein
MANDASVEIDPDSIPQTDGVVSYSAFAIVAEIGSGGVVKILVLDARETDPKSGRQFDKLECPGGTGLRGEVPVGILAREFSAECLIRPVTATLFPDRFPDSAQPAPGSMWAQELVRYTRPGDVRKGGGTHHQIFFLVKLGCGPENYRTAPMNESDGTILGVPKMVEIEAFIHDQKSKRAHVNAVKLMLERLYNEDMNVGQRYHHLFR